MRFLGSRNFCISRRWLFLGILVVFAFGILPFLNLGSGYDDLPMIDSSRHLPLLYWHHRSMYPQSYRNSNCTRAPSPRRLRHICPFWQYVKNTVGNVIASSAFWDDRLGSPAIRILVYSDFMKIDEISCQLWYFNRKDPIIVRAQDIYAWRKEDTENMYDDSEEAELPFERIVEPHVLTCSVPTDASAPAAVSLVTDQCAGATNLLRVQGAPIDESVKDQLPGIWTSGDRIRNVLEPNGVCVCAVLPPHNRDVSARIAEWLELLKHFGVDMIYLYVTMTHPNVRRVINHYQWLGFLQVSYFSMPFAEDQVEKQRKRPWQSPNKLSNRKRQQVIYNDCLYRSIGWHRWIVPLRLDDLIVPIRDGNLVKLAERELEQSHEPPDALSFSAFRFYPREYDSSELKMVDHQWRLNESFSDAWNIRSMNNIDTVIILQEYLPLWCAGGTIRLSDGSILDRGDKKHLCQVHNVDSDAARVHAYGSTCKGCGDLVRDTRMQRWRDVAEETDALLTELTDQ